MTLSNKRRIAALAIGLLFLWAWFWIYEAYESRRDVRALHRDMREEGVMDEQSEAMHKLVLADPKLWTKEHPRTYNDLMWMFVRHGILTTTQAKTSIAFDEACAPDYRILLKYAVGSREPTLTNSRIEILGMR